MKIKNKIIISVLILLMCIIFGKTYAQASLSDARTIAEQGGGAVGSKITLSFGSDIGTSSNDIIYCMSQGQHNSGSSDYKILSYLEIENGVVTVFDADHPTGNRYVETKESKILAEILSGNYGAGYGSGAGNYTDAQRGLYYYFNTWIDVVGQYVGTDASWYMENGYTDNGVGAAVVAKATAAVEAGANPSAKIYLLDNWNAADNWQRLAIALPSAGSNAQLTIKKVDEDTGRALANVGFKVRKNDTNEYIVYNNGAVTYTASEDGATTFKTNSQGTITIKGLTAGYYTIKEVSNPNSGYNTATNVGKETRVLINTNGSGTVTITNKKPTTPTGPTTGSGSGTVTISGTVWEASLGYKDNSYDDTFSFSNFSDTKGNKGVQGVTVYWWNSARTKLLGKTTTNANGNYSMTRNIQIKDHEYNAVNQPDYIEINNSFIEFEYNGFKYTTVAYNDQANGSRAKEIPSTRAALDEKFKEVSNGTVKDGNFSITTDSNGYTANVGNSGLVRATTNGNLSNLMQSPYATTSMSGKEYCHSHCYSAQHHDGCKWSGCYTTSYWCNTHQTYHSRRVHVDCNGNHCMDQTYADIDTWNIPNINLGLVQREQPDVALTSDISQVRVIMKGQQYTYKYGNRGIQDNTQLFETKVKFGGTYTRYVNPADISYVNYNNSNEMEVYVTYQIIAKNHSNTLPVTINQIANYYDSRYTIHRGVGWSSGSSAGNGFDVAYYNQIINLQPNSTSNVIEIEFKVNDDTIKGLLNNDMTLKNVSEITSYTSFYGTTTMSSEHQNASSKGLVGSQYAGVDRNSIPGNYNVNNDSPYEDDTSDAPSFLLTKDPNYKIISGNVYEDTTRNDIKAGEERNGDGTNDSEPGVGHVRVELLKVKDDGTTEVAKLYTVENGSAGIRQAITYTDGNGHYAFGYNGENGEPKPTYYENANDTTGNNNFIKIGVTADNYIIRYTYGDGTQTYIGDTSNIISARNYKSTIINNDNNASIYGVIHDNNGNNMWHLTATDNRSIAIDDLNVRNNIDTSLKHNNFDTSVNNVDISAYTKPFKVQLEYTKDQQFDVETNGLRKGEGDFDHNWTIFDFGIAERAREDIVIDKTISNLKITLGNGQVLMDGNPRTDTMNYLKYLGNDKNQNHPNSTRAEAMTRQSKLAYIEMDTELIQGATLDIIYTITVTNNSEKDYDYRTDSGRYYYYGDKSSSQEMPTTVELVADYMDPELTCYVGSDASTGDNQQWIKTTGEDLKNEGLISDNVNNRLKDGEYLVFKTEYFKDVKSNSSKSLTLHASKLLANSAEDYIYENHTEILQTNGQIARTIDKVDYRDNSKQVVKTYTPGNYIPSLSNRHTNVDGTLEDIGLHQQDDDAITIRITPPTGISSYYTSYIIASVIGLMVIVVGIIIIKKKVLDK